MTQAQAERLGHSLPGLILQARRIAATVAAGAHGRRASGPGDEFWQYRLFAPGDSAARIDWRQSGKGQHTFVRETEWETAHSVYLWCDGSPSMDFGAKGATKQDRALLLTMALALLLLRGGERVRVLNDPKRRFGGRHAFDELAAALAAPAASWPRADIPAHAHVLLASDFLQPPDEIENGLTHLASQQASATLLQVLDSAECDLPYHGPIRFEGMEQEADIVIGDADSVRADYQRALAAHRQHLGSLCARRQFGHLFHRTDHAPETALMTVYQRFAARL